MGFWLSWPAPTSFICSWCLSQMPAVPTQPGTSSASSSGLFVIALIVRFAYVRLRSGAGPFLSPWIVVIAAVIVMLMRLTNPTGA